MQSSAMVAIRTMIMISCLVAVPLAAVFGTALPKAVQSAFGGRSRSYSWHHSPAGDDEPSPPSVLTMDEPGPKLRVAAQSHHEPVVAAESPRLPTAHITGVRPIEDAVAAQVVETAPLWNPSPRVAQAPKSRDMTAHFAPLPLPRRTDTRSEPRTSGLQKTVYSQPYREPSDDDEPTADKPIQDGQIVSLQRPAAAASNALTEGERRLRQLGASYYRLEAWGGDAHLYRCSCNIALSPGSRATRHFEAIEAEPSQAIDAVIKQVDAWRARTSQRR
jgi:hypothetical protein